MTKVLDNLLEDLLESHEDKALMEHLNISIEKNNKGFSLYCPKNI
jgi:hypothetical protein